MFDNFHDWLKNQQRPAAKRVVIDIVKGQHACSLAQEEHKTVSYILEMHEEYEKRKNDNYDDSEQCDIITCSFCGETFEILNEIGGCCSKCECIYMEL